MNKVNKKEDMINLNNWLYEDRNDEERRNLFLGLSSTQKKLNNQGYGIASFNLNDIYLEDGKFSTVSFDMLRKLPEDISKRRRIVSEEIFILVLMQIGVYTDCLSSISSNSIKENFDMFLPFLPNSDVAYYKSIIESHVAGETNCIYYVDYVRELAKRKKAIAGEQDTDTGSNRKEGKRFSKSNGDKRIEVYEDSTFDNYKNAAYINFIVIPIGVVIAGIILTILSWFIK